MGLAGVEEHDLSDVCVPRPVLSRRLHDEHLDQLQQRRGCEKTIFDIDRDPRYDIFRNQPALVYTENPCQHQPIELPISPLRLRQHSCTSASSHTRSYSSTRPRTDRPRLLPEALHHQFLRQPLRTHDVLPSTDLLCFKTPGGPCSPSKCPRPSWRNPHDCNLQADPPLHAFDRAVVPLQLCFLLPRHSSADNGPASSPSPIFFVLSSSSIVRTFRWAC